MGGDWVCIGKGEGVSGVSERVFDPGGGSEGNGDGTEEWEEE